MDKKRILKDPETGEIVGATRTPFSRAAKEHNKKVFAEKFEKSRIAKEDLPEKSPSSGKYLFFAVLAILLGLGLWLWRSSG